MARRGNCRLNSSGVAAIRKIYQQGRWCSVQAFCDNVGIARSTYYELIGRKIWFEQTTIQGYLKQFGIDEANHAALYEFKDTEAELPPTEPHCVPNAPVTGNLPKPPTICIGREAEVAEITALLDSWRLVTLREVGGVGKTRLAIEVAEKIAGDYAAGVWFVDLASLNDPNLVVQTVASTLNAGANSGCSLLPSLINFLQEKSLLLILDNCEHLLESCATLMTALLSALPQLRVLATSRECLNIPFEHPFLVPALEVPEQECLSGKKDIARWVQGYDSVRLFVERARVLRSDFEVTQENALLLASICRRLDGIPLAIGLAAALVDAISIEDLESGLNDCLSILTEGNRAAPRHQTLRATIDWSYQRLEPKLQTLLVRLSVFAGGWTLEAAQQICADSNMKKSEVRNLLTSLVKKSLVVFEREGKGRYRLLETIRQYGQEMLTPAERTDLERSHAECFLRLAEKAKGGIQGQEQPYWLDRLEAEHDNVLTALQWAKEHSSEVGIRIANAMSLFWDIRGYWQTGYTWLMGLLEYAQDVDAATRGRSLQNAGNLAKMQKDYSTAHKAFQASYDIFLTLNDERNLAIVLNNLGCLAQDLGHNEEARKHFEASLELRQRLPDRPGEANVYANLGYLEYCENNVETAQQHLKATLAILEGRETYLRASTLNNLGGVMRLTKDFPAARARLEESLCLRYNRLHDHKNLAYSFDEFALLAEAEGKPVRAVHLFAAAEAQRNRENCSLTPLEKARRHDMTTRLEAALKESFSIEWQIGLSLTEEEAIRLALEKTED